jgi:hypothetical protein
MMNLQTNTIATPKQLRLIDMKDGLHENVPSAVYHQRELGLVSNSALKEFSKTPAHYRTWVDGGEDEEEKAAFRIGRATHCAILEPDVFASTYAAEPDFGDCRKTDRTTTEDARENKLRRNEWRAKHAGREFISTDEFAMLCGMRDSVRRHPLARGMVTGGKSEVTAIWTDTMTGLRCKIRADHFIGSKFLITDLKTTKDASPRSFARDAFNYNYHWAHALYRAGFAALGLPAKHFWFLAVEKTPPYAVATYQLDEPGIAAGHERVRSLMMLLADCVRRNEWDAYPVKVQTLETPKWAA